MSLLSMPEEELAKLVLGYLANEQLKTVYDEFILASPHLDAGQNEYSRIFMKSLESIVSEYWAAKIYVEKCKPFNLRKRLSKCSDLLEVVKFLISHVDIKKISSFNCSNDKTSNFNQTQNCTIKRYCTSCGSLRDVCGCRRASDEADSRDVTPASLEATALTDLAGNSKAKVKRRHVKVLEKDSKEAARLLGCDAEDRGRRPRAVSRPDASAHNTSHSHYNNFTVQPVDVTDSQAISSIRLSTTPSLFSTTVEGEPYDVTSKTSNRGIEDVSSNGAGCPNAKNLTVADSTEPEKTTSTSTSQLPPTRLVPGVIAVPNSMQYLIQVTGSKNLEIVPHTADDTKSSKVDDKITILSDVKVDSAKGKGKGKDAMVTSTPLLKVHQIVLATTQQADLQKGFTKEEIMAMPTCFVVSSSSGPLPVRTLTDSRPASGVCVSGSASVATSLGPLTIDITSSPLDNQTKVSDRIASVPKESLLAVGKASTPQVLPPARRSSSTPRRSSHIRVLDFSTPRRILQEAISEAPMQEEEVVSRSPDLRIDETPRDRDVTEPTPKAFARGKSGWDADLRALVADAPPSTQTKRKRKPPPKEPPLEPKTAKKAPKRPPKAKKERPPKASTSGVAKPAAPPPARDGEVAVKPTINVIVDWNEKPADEPADTPELERISLQHDIGAKLNISDLLETPFKQALYDIQMDTPKFLRPDVPDGPVSEIKISDIPTPRFFEAMSLGLTPRPQTPAYASRATDYSSGGSYYKPDDDYALPPQDVQYPGVGKDKSKTSEDNSDKSSGSGSRPLRPVRKCARNVSYRAKRKCAELDTSEASAAASHDEDTKENAKSENRMKCDKRQSTGKTKRSPQKKTTPKSFMKIKPRRPTPKRKASTASKRKSTVRDESADATRTPAPTKSRRKSATPRKLHTKVFGGESPEHSSESADRPEPQASADTEPPTAAHDADSKPRLRWSDECSRDPPKETVEHTEAEDITKIQQYIASTEAVKRVVEDSGQLHIDLVKRGFDIETAKSIERDLLDLSPVNTTVVTSVVVQAAPVVALAASAADTTAADTRESDASSNKQRTPEDDDEDEVELSVCECDDDRVIRHTHDEAEQRTSVVHTLKENYTMEFCLEEDFSVTLRTSAFRSTLECEPEVVLDKETVLETQAAVESIITFDSLYTPMKRAVQAQCKEIFDSTLTSIDTPLKPASPAAATVTEILVHVEHGTEEGKARPGKRRRRIQSGSGSDESATDTKKPKSEARYLTNIQNIDIETVLSKLHGP